MFYKLVTIFVEFSCFVPLSTEKNENPKDLNQENTVFTGRFPISILQSLFCNRQSCIHLTKSAFFLSQTLFKCWKSFKISIFKFLTIYSVEIFILHDSNQSVFRDVEKSPWRNLRSHFLTVRQHESCKSFECFHHSSNAYSFPKSIQHNTAEVQLYILHL